MNGGRPQTGLGAHIIPFGGKTPSIHPTAFVAPGCCIIGDVEIGEHASIWYNCVLRGDVNAIRVGARSNIQDGTIVHCDAPNGHEPGWPVIIGEEVLIGHLAIVHGCRLEARSLVGLGAVVMNGCTLEENAMLAAGALLPPGKTIPARQLWMGRPAQFSRHMTADYVKSTREGVSNYVRHAGEHLAAVTMAFDGQHQC